VLGTRVLGIGQAYSNVVSAAANHCIFDVATAAGIGRNHGVVSRYCSAGLAPNAETEEPMPVVLVEFAETDVGTEDHDLVAALLRTELLELDVDDVRLAAAEGVPAGAKGGAATTGGLIVSLANSAAFGAVLTSLVQVLRAWIMRGQGRRVTLKDGERSLELTGASVDQQQQAVEAFARSMAERN
jgi:hypothetical protein